MTHGATKPPRLLIRRDLQVLRSVDLVSNITIGRSSRSDIELDHPSVSRSHARLEQRESDWFVVDCGSTNGVLINGLSVEAAKLKSGDVIEIRPFSLNYLAGPTDQGDRSFELVGHGAITTAAALTEPGPAIAKRRLEDLYALARAVVKRTDEGTPWEAVRDTLQRSLSAQRCVLIGMDKVVGLYRLAPCERSGSAPTPLDVSGSVLREVTDSRRGVLIESVTDDRRYAAATSLVEAHVSSVLCVPVVVQDQTRAIVYADRRQIQRPFTSDDLGFVTAAVDLAAAAVELDELHNATRQLARVRGRIEAAREIQEMLLPQPVPQPAWGEVAARNVPAEQLSGDIYDVSLDARGRLVTWIADVSGKGVPASFLTAVLQSTLRAAFHERDDFEGIVRHVNSVIEAQTPADAFVTALICRWSPDGDMVEIANAGHLAPMWITSSGRVECHPERIGLPLGIDPAWDGHLVREDATDLVALTLYSDGATEACNPQGEQYGSERLQQQVEAIGDRGAGDIIGLLVEDIARFCTPLDPTDDVTVVCVRRERG